MSYLTNARYVCKQYRSAVTRVPVIFTMVSVVVILWHIWHCCSVDRLHQIATFCLQRIKLKWGYLCVPRVGEGGVDVYIHLLLSSTIDGGEWLALETDTFTRGDYSSLWPESAKCTKGWYCSYNILVWSKVMFRNGGKFQEKAEELFTERVVGGQWL